MTKLALSLPGFPSVDNTPMDTKLFTDASGNVTLAAAITRFSEVALFVGGFLMFFWALWGVFDYLKAEGNKESLAKARKKMIWAISGFIILVMAFFIGSALQQIIAPNSSSRTVEPLTF